ncbi:alpha/beta fold hydrolase [Ningiella sp. W23]|uniref:alpha/beta fold hydrolase n=1 Tax=Ningiella sp. W23 TaxID=3023715 RepID=UPI003757F93E
MPEKRFDDDRIVDAVYDSALAPQRFDALVRAWDDVFVDSQIDKAELFLSKARNTLSRHFERADQIFLSTQNVQHHSVQDIVDSEPTSAFITDTKGQIIASNASATENLCISHHMNVHSLPLDAKSETQLNTLLKQMASKRDDAQTLAIRGVNQFNNQAFVLVAQRLVNTAKHAQDSTLILFKSSLVTWHSGIEKVLANAFELTSAEIEVIESLNKGLSLKEIAQQRARSLNTIRTQMKSILQKTETQTQSNLMRHVTSLLLVANKLEEKQLPISEPEYGFAEFPLKTINTTDGNTIRYRDYGKPKASPVLCFFPVLPSKQHASFIEPFLKRGLRLITLEEPENLPLSFRSKKDEFEHYLRCFNELLTHLKLKKVVALGHCVGGIYANEYAKRFPEQVRAVYCVDTGAPLQSQTQWEQMGKTARRTFMLAKNFPSMLLMPHRLVAHRFFKSKDGQEQVINYFYADNPDDVKNIQGDVRLKEWALNLLSYCLRDIKRPIRACEMWVQNWYPTLAQVLETIPVFFIHGDKNQQFSIDDLHELADRHERLSVAPANGAAQLTLMTHTDLIALLIAEQCYLDASQEQALSSQL